MRLLLVVSNFPPVIGGIQTYAYELAKQLGPRCAELLVVAPRSDGDREFDRTSAFETVRLQGIGDDLALSGIVPLALLLRRRTFDAVFATHWAPAYAVMKAAKLARVTLPVFVAAHGKELLHRPLARVPAAQGVYDRTRRFVLHHATGFFPVSERTAQLLAAGGAAPARITVVPNGVDIARHQPRDATRLREEMSPGGPMLLSIARLVTRKGIDTVLRALPSVLREVPSLTYVIVGEGPDRSRLERLAAELSLVRNVCFMGRASEGSVLEFYNACDVFVLPAREEPGDIEGFGLVFLEAGACGKPVIGARAGGVVDAIVDGETGLLVPPDDPVALAEALASLFRDPEHARQLGANARERILRRCTWNHAADQIFTRIASA